MRPASPIAPGQRARRPSDAHALFHLSLRRAGTRRTNRGNTMSSSSAFRRDRSPGWASGLRMARPAGTAAGRLKVRGSFDPRTRDVRGEGSVRRRMIRGRVLRSSTVSRTRGGDRRRLSALRAATASSGLPRQLARRRAPGKRTGVVEARDTGAARGPRAPYAAYVHEDGATTQPDRHPDGRCSLPSVRAACDRSVAR